MIWLAAAAKRVLGFIVPVPLVLILAALAWVQFDKHSAVREAVNERVKEMVAGAEIAALKAEAAAQRDIAARSADAAQEAERRSTVFLETQTALIAALSEVRAEKESLNAEIDDLLSRPVADNCAVDPGLAGRLRSR